MKISRFTPTDDQGALTLDASSGSSIASSVPPASGNFLTQNFGGQDGYIGATCGATYTIDCSLANIFDLTLTANLTLTIINAPAGGSVAAQILVALRQGGSGSYTVTWPASVKWRSSTGTNTGSAPTLYTAVGAQDDVLLSSVDGGSTWGAEPFAHDPSTGTVTSVALTVPAEFSVAGSPITTSGTLAVTKANETANTVWAGPTSGAAAAPTFRALVTADLTAAPIWRPVMVHDTDGTHWDVLTDTSGNAIMTT